MTQPASLPIARQLDAIKLYQQAATAFTQAGAFLVPQPKQWLVTLARIAQVALHLREYALVTVEDIEPAWSQLRAVPAAVDVLAATAADLTLVMETTWDAVAAALAQANHAILSRGSDLAYQAIDEAFAESFAKAEEYQKLLAANRWLVLLLLLRRSGVFSLVTREAVKPAASDTTPAVAAAGSSA